MSSRDIPQERLCTNPVIFFKVKKIGKLEKETPIN